MHEISVVSNIIKIALKTAEENKLKVIEKIKIIVGSQHHLAPDLMEYAFTFFSENTIAEGAKLIIEKIPVIMICLDCKKEFKVQNQVYICPECSSVQLNMKSGRELIIENIEGER